MVGRGNITSTHTSDLWPWTGKDGRDYVLVGVDADDAESAMFEASRPIPIYPASSSVPSWRIQRAVRTVDLVSAGYPVKFAFGGAAKAINRDNALKGMPVPLHPGAAKFYKEAGAM